MAVQSARPASVVSPVGVAPVVTVVGAAAAGAGGGRTRSTNPMTTAAVASRIARTTPLASSLRRGAGGA